MNQVGHPKKSQRKTQLKFRYSSLTSLNRIKSKELKRFALGLLVAYHNIARRNNILVAAVLCLMQPHRFITNYFPNYYKWENLVQLELKCLLEIFMKE